MTKERELLEETLLFLDEFEYPTIVEEIRAYLAAEPEADEPVAWIQPNHLDKAQFMPFLCRVEPKQRDDFIPLYTRPEPARKPMTKEELNELIAKEYLDDWDERMYKWGFRDAEKHHGIGGDDNG